MIFNKFILIFLLKSSFEAKNPRKMVPFEVLNGKLSKITRYNYKYLFILNINNIILNYIRFPYKNYQINHFIKHK